MEGDLEMCEDKMLVATQKLDKVIIRIIGKHSSKQENILTNKKGFFHVKLQPLL